MGKIITFAQQKGGAGKTTVLVQLAEYWSSKGLKIGLVDLDPQGSLARWSGLRGDPTLTCVMSSDWKASGDIRASNRKNDLTLVDCPGNADILLRATIRDSDLVVSPCQPSPMDAWAIAPVVDMAKREKTPMKVLLNRVPPRGGALDQVLAELDGLEVLESRLGNRVSFSTAFFDGRSAREAGKRGKAAQEVKSLGEELLTAINGL